MRHWRGRCVSRGELRDARGAGEEPVGWRPSSESLLKLHYAGHFRSESTSPKHAGSRSSVVRGRRTRSGVHLGPARRSPPGDTPAHDLDLKGGSTLAPRIILENILIGLALPRDRLSLREHFKTEPLNVFYVPDAALFILLSDGWSGCVSSSENLETTTRLAQRVERNVRHTAYGRIKSTGSEVIQGRVLS